MFEDPWKSDKPKNHKIRVDEDVKQEVKKRKTELELKRGERVCENDVLKSMFVGEKDEEDPFLGIFD